MSQNQKKPDMSNRYYAINFLNKWFAIASVLFLMAVVGILVRDYFREWKTYQKEFRVLEAQQLLEEYAEKSEQLNKNKDYDKANKQFAEAQAAFQEKHDEYADAQKTLSRLKGAMERSNKIYQFAKAEYGAALFRHEEALAGHGNAEATLKELQGWATDRDEKFALYEEDQFVFDQQEAIVAEYSQELKAAQKNMLGFSRELDLVKRRLAKVDPGSMDLQNKVGSIVRDLPMLEMFAPYYKVDQIVLKDLPINNNFVDIPTVDRCITCHKGIDRAGFEDAPQPYRTHPKLDMYLSSDSPHPIEKFACTSCHSGRGRGTTFNSAAHTPNSPEQAKEWKEKYGYKPIKHWDKPMYALKHVQAGCFKCHSNETSIMGADNLNLGMHLIEQSGCYGCHKIEKYEHKGKPGPSLMKMNNKNLSDEWMYHWIRDPHSFRHSTNMPAYFLQSNNSTPEDIARTDQEIHAMAAYLKAKSQTEKLSAIPTKGDAANGAELVASLGCYGCHVEQEEADNETMNTMKLYRAHGPNLIGLGSKVSPEWLYHWLKEPANHSEHTRMPNMRLTDQEAADITAHLMQSKSAEFDARKTPSVDDAELNKIAKNFLGKMLTSKQADEKLAAMSQDEKLVYSGKNLISHYGCFGCHDIAGFEQATAVGVELTEEGSKSLHLFDFGHQHDIEHTKQAWFWNKLKNPRIYDEGTVKQPYDKLKMPNFYFTDEEADALTTALLGFVKKNGVVEKERSPGNLFVEDGQKLVRELNCQGCHIMEGQGGAIYSTVADWLVEYEGKSQSEADAMHKSFSPPNLIGEGKKVHPEWLFEFLHNPEHIRPWLAVRMPSYKLSEAERNGLVKYFSYLDDEPFPFVLEAAHADAESIEAGEKLFSPDYFDCLSCHIQGDKMPSGSPDRWAPNFALSKRRLKPEWIKDWLYDPQKLLPGTKMPTYFDPEYFDYSGPDDILGGDEHKQIEAMRDYLLSLDEETKKEEKTESASMSV